MIDPKPSDVGRTVIGGAAGTRSKKGEVIAYDRAYVFVLWEGRAHAMATRRENLHWERADKPDKAHEARLIDEILGT